MRLTEAQADEISNRHDGQGEEIETMRTAYWVEDHEAGGYRLMCQSETEERPLLIGRFASARVAGDEAGMRAQSQNDQAAYTLLPDWASPRRVGPRAAWVA